MAVKPRYLGPPSDHFDGVRLFSPYGLNLKTLADVLKWQFTSKRTPWPKHVINTVEPRVASHVAEGEMALTFVNHVTCLLQWPGFNLLTDPVWSERASPFAFAGPRRVRPPGIAFEKLPKIHFVLVSHNHYDHFDEATLKRLAREHDPLFVVALGDGRLLEKIPGARFAEMDWWETKALGEGLRVHFVPAQHWSARWTSDRNLSLWGGFVLEGRGPTTYFAGDTGFAPHFEEIARRCPPIDLALLPIGAYEPRWFMRSQHMDPAEAVRAHEILKARHSVGVHFGTWQLTDEGIDQPVKDLVHAREKAGVTADAFGVLDQGETKIFRVSEISIASGEPAGPRR